MRIKVRDFFMLGGFLGIMMPLFLSAKGEGNFTMTDSLACLAPSVIMLFIGLFMYSNYSKAIRGDNSLMWSNFWMYFGAAIVAFGVLYFVL